MSEARRFEVMSEYTVYLCEVQAIVNFFNCHIKSVISDLFFRTLAADTYDVMSCLHALGRRWTKNKIHPPGHNSHPCQNRN